LLIDQS